MTNKILDLFVHSYDDIDQVDELVFSIWDCQLTTIASNRLRALGIDTSSSTIEVTIDYEIFQVTIAGFPKEESVGEVNWEKPNFEHTFHLNVTFDN